MSLSISPHLAQDPAPTARVGLPVLNATVSVRPWLSRGGCKAQQSHRRGGNVHVLRPDRLTRVSSKRGQAGQRGAILRKALPPAGDGERVVGRAGAVAAGGGIDRLGEGAARRIASPGRQSCPRPDIARVDCLGVRLVAVPAGSARGTGPHRFR